MAPGMVPFDSPVSDFMTRELEVVQLIDKRVGPPVAATCLIDHSPPPPDPDEDPMPFLRDRGSGRPTKRERRQLDRFRGPG